MSNPSPPVFNLSGGNTGTTDIPLVFDTPGTNLQILWTYDGSDPTTGTIWSSGQVIPYNSWPYANASSALATTYVQAIMHDTVQDTYSAPVVQDYTFTCANPVITQTTTVNVSCSSPGSLLWYYAGTASNFDPMAATATQVANPCALSLANGTYVFFATTADGVVYNPSIVDTTVTAGAIVATPVIFANGASNHVFVSAVSATIGAVLHYTLDGTTPTSGSAVLTSQVYAALGTVVSVLAVSDASQSQVATTTIKSTGYYAMRGLYGASRAARVSSSVPRTRLSVRSFTVPC